LISGNGRNSGKTTLACRLVRHFSDKLDITGIKISPHFHEQNEYEEVIYADDTTILIREIKTSGRKDSSRMLHSGAREVIFVQTRNKLLHTAVMKLNPIWESGVPVICESGGLIEYLRPGLFFMVNRYGNLSQKSGNPNYDHVDKRIESHGGYFDFDIDSIGFSNSRWFLKGINKQLK